MDSESVEVLNRLVVRWRLKAEQWQTSSHDNDHDRLDSDIEMLVRHMEGMQSVQNTLTELERICQTLVRLRSGSKKLPPPAAAASTSADKELLHIEQEMRKLHCHHEEFLVKYLMVKDNYRTPPSEALPLPHGFQCHKQYRLQLDLMKARMENVLRQAETARQELLQMQAKSLPLDFYHLTAEINQCMSTYHSLRVSLYHLLQHVEPIDTEAFHAQCSALIDRKLKCLEAKRLDQLQDLATHTTAAAASSSTPFGGSSDQTDGGAALEA